MKPNIWSCGRTMLLQSNTELVAKLDALEQK
jgi:hypothetical protein